MQKILLILAEILLNLLVLKVKSSMGIRKVVGIHSVREALVVRKSSEIKSIYFRPDWRSNTSLLELEQIALSKHVEHRPISLKELDNLAQNHQGVCLHVEGAPQFDLKNLPEQAVVLILDQIEDPKNLGAIIRTSWLMGVKALFLPPHHSASLSPSVMKVASGGVEHVPIETGSLLRWIETLKENRFWIYGLGVEHKDSLWSEKFEGRLAFVLGGEQSGIRRSLIKTCDKFLFIPQVKKSASYNVSVATGILLGECFRQLNF